MAEFLPCLPFYSTADGDVKNSGCVWLRAPRCLCLYYTMGFIGIVMLMQNIYDSYHIYFINHLIWITINPYMSLK